MFNRAGQVALFVLLSALFNGCSSGSDHHGHHHAPPGDDVTRDVTAIPIAAAACVNDMAGRFPCRFVDLTSGLDFSTQASDIWGWHDERSGIDYALLGLSVGTAFVRLADPSAPEFIAFLPTVTEESHWRDIKVLDHYALIVSEASAHGLQIVDLHRIADFEEYAVIDEDVHYRGFGKAHNIAVNEETAMAYAVGSGTCSGGLHMIDMTSPLLPKFAGCYADDGYIHDVQCVVYQGPDTEFLGHELCFAANAVTHTRPEMHTLTIVDVSTKTAPQRVAKKSYVGASYAHQGWLTEDQRYFLLGDEGDEVTYGQRTRTYIWDLTDLRNPIQSYEFTADTVEIDHNLYILGDHVYQANYQAGVRILRHGELAQGEMVEVGYFDTVPPSDKASGGAWSVYPFYANGMMVTVNIEGEFFVLHSRVEELARCSDGMDNDGDGHIDSSDPGCESATDTQE